MNERQLDDLYQHVLKKSNDINLGLMTKPAAEQKELKKENKCLIAVLESIQRLCLLYRERRDKTVEGPKFKI